MVEAGEARHALRAHQRCPSPSVVRLSRYVRVPYRREVPLTRRAVLDRDGHALRLLRRAGRHHRPRPAALARRSAHLDERGGRLRPVQPPQGRPAAGRARLAAAAAAGAAAGDGGRRDGLDQAEPSWQRATWTRPGRAGTTASPRPCDRPPACRPATVRSCAALPGRPSEVARCRTVGRSGSGFAIFRSMTIVETVLVFVAIPLAVVALVVVAVYGRSMVPPAQPLPPRQGVRRYPPVLVPAAPRRPIDDVVDDRVALDASAEPRTRHSSCGGRCQR